MSAFDLTVGDPPIENPGAEGSPSALNNRSPLGSVSTAFGRAEAPQSRACQSAFDWGSDAYSMIVIVFMARQSA
jgi:hypothetical protein